MELYDENQEVKKSKVPAIIGIVIICLTILTIVIICMVFYLKSSITTIKIDGVKNLELESLLYVEQTESGKEIYVPILKVANLFGYEGFNGDYKIKSENKTKCHVVSENETAMFTQDSDTILKVSNGSDAEYVKIDKPVVEMNGELYTTVDGLQKGFNILFSNDELLKNINIYTMDYLVTLYANKWKYEEYSADFSDKKAIFEGMLIVNDENKNYGVINIENGKNILENKYEQIKYIPSTTDFMVKSNSKYGIVTKEAQNKIRQIYDTIQLINNEKESYLVKQNNVYGIIDSTGNTIINVEYAQIGIDSNQYSQNGIENGYILLNELIPVKNNKNLWAIFDINGKQITDFKYSAIGSEQSSVSNSYPVVNIEGHNVLVVKKEKTYNLISMQGEELIPNDIVDSIYLKTEGTTGKNSFYMTYNGKTSNIESYLNDTGR